VASFRPFWLENEPTQGYATFLVFASLSLSAIIQFHGHCKHRLFPAWNAANCNQCTQPFSSPAAVTFPRGAVHDTGHRIGGLIVHTGHQVSVHAEPLAVSASTPEITFVRPSRENIVSSI
jgi:hypothetical protein